MEDQRAGWRPRPDGNQPGATVDPMLSDNNGNPEEGAVQASAQGQLVNTNGNGMLDSLQARGALLKTTMLLPSGSVTIHSGAASEECGRRPARILPMRK